MRRLGKIVGNSCGPGTLKWRSRKGPDRRKQRYTQERYTWGIWPAADCGDRGVYTKGDTFRGILELQLEAAVLELMVFGKLKKGNGSAGAVLCVCVYFTIFITFGVFSVLLYSVRMRKR